MSELLIILEMLSMLCLPLLQIVDTVSNATVEKPRWKSHGE
jgi:hypothetical protein